MFDMQLCVHNSAGLNTICTVYMRCLSVGCVGQPVSLLVCLSVCLPNCLSVSVCLSVCLGVCLSVTCLSVCVCLPSYLSVTCLPVCLLSCLSVTCLPSGLFVTCLLACLCLSVCLSVSTIIRARHYWLGTKTGHLEICRFYQFGLQWIPWQNVTEKPLSKLQ